MAVVATGLAQDIQRRSCHSLAALLVSALAMIAPVDATSAFAPDRPISAARKSGRNCRRAIPAISGMSSPVVNTPVPAITPSAAMEPSAKPLPTFTPMRRPPIPPRQALPTPSIAPETSDAARPPMPKDVPRRTMPPRMTPPPAVTTPAPSETPASAQPPAAEERQKNRKQLRPGPLTESGTPTPTPTTPPN